MTTLPRSKFQMPPSLGPIVLFAVVYLGALAIIFAPEGSLSSTGPTVSAFN